MKLDGAAVHYLLAREFGEAIHGGPFRSISVDYPMLYDPSADMRGHTVLVPDHERPDNIANMRDVLCVCIGAAAATAARNAGFAVIEADPAITFRRLYNFMQAAFVSHERLDARLRAYVDAHAGFQPLLDACSETLGCSCVLIDEQYRSIYQAFKNPTTDTAASAELLEGDVIDLFMASRGYRHMRQSHNVFTMPGSSDLLMKNIFSDGALVGTLVIPHEGDVLSARYVRFILNYLSTFVEEMRARTGSFEIPRTISGGVRMALDEALSGDPSAVATLATALVEDGHNRDARYVVVKIERSFTHDGADERDYIARRFELAWPGAYCFVANGELFMLADIDDISQSGLGSFDQDLPLIARDNLSKLGISRTFDAMEGLRAARYQAIAALECGSAIDPTRWCYRFGDYALPWIVMRASGSEPLESFRHPAISILERYDSEHATNLVNTLATFLWRRFNATAASEELFIARSTLLNRLERIRELTGIDWEDADDLLYLGVSLKMR